MKKAAAVVAVIVMVLGAAGTMFAEEKKAEPPKPITFETKMGTVTFDHAKHLAAVGGDCKTCHPAIFPESKADVGYKAAMHKTAETEKKSCGACHHAGGKAFESKGNCQRCHVKKAA